MTKEPRRFSSLGEMINAELQQSERSHPVEGKPHAEINVDAAITVMSSALLPQLRADQQLLHRAAALNEMTRRADQAARARALMEAPPVDVDLYE